MHIKIVSEAKGTHVHERVFVGVDEHHLALAGTLVFRIGEAQLFGTALLLGAEQMHGHLTVWTDPDGKALQEAYAAENRSLGIPIVSYTFEFQKKEDAECP